MVKNPEGVQGSKGWAGQQEREIAAIESKCSERRSFLRRPLSRASLEREIENTEIEEARFYPIKFNDLLE
jgi:hypothetical protein